MERSRRTIAAGDVVIRALQAHKSRQAVKILRAGTAYQRNGYLFASRTSTHVGISSARRAWKAALVVAKLPEVRLYDSRHTHISQLLANGAILRAVSARAGHSSPTTTLQFYAHLLPGADEALAKMADSLLTGTA